MKTLANAKDKDEILERLRAIGPESERRWGKMSAREMICHLNDSFLVSMGEKDAQPVSNLFSRTVFKWVGLWAPMKWPRRIKTVPECEQGKSGTAPSEFERDMGELAGAMGRFTAEGRSLEGRAHPIFGRMTEEEWLRWEYLHMDHHLRQFGRDSARVKPGPVTEQSFSARRKVLPFEGRSIPMGDLL